MKTTAMVAIALLTMSTALLSAHAAPAGAKFKCTDGTYSTAATARGACSAHGGVSATLPAKAAAPAPAPAPAHAAMRAAAPAPAPAPVPAPAMAKRTPAPAPAPAPAAAPVTAQTRAAAAGTAPANATAKCKDGTFSTSAHRAGTCSGHRGVDTWIKQPAN